MHFITTKYEHYQTITNSNVVETTGKQSYKSCKQTKTQVIQPDAKSNKPYIIVFHVLSRTSI